MKSVRVLIPFTDKETGKTYAVDDVIELTDSRIESIKAVNPNMVLVLGEADKPKRKTKAKE